MLRKNIMIRHRLGLHTHASMKWVQTARCFMSDITLNFQDQHVDVKSILGMNTLRLQRGSVVEVVVRGRDEQEALTALEELVEH